MIVWVAIVDYGSKVHLFEDGSRKEIYRKVHKTFPEALDLYWTSELYDIEETNEDVLMVSLPTGSLYITAVEVK